MDDAADQESVKDFLNESGERLEALNGFLLRLEEMMETGVDVNVIDAMFRDAHSVKGMSGMLGLGNINRLAHKMEDLLDLLRKSKIQISPEVVDVLFSCFDGLTMLIGEVAQSGSDHQEIGEILEALEAVMKTAEGAGEAAPLPYSVPIDPILAKNMTEVENIGLFVAERDEGPLYQVDLWAFGEAARDEVTALLQEAQNTAEIVVSYPAVSAVLQGGSFKNAEDQHRVIYVTAAPLSAEEYLKRLSRRESGAVEIDLLDLRDQKRYQSRTTIDKKTEEAGEEAKIDTAQYLGLFLEETGEQVEEISAVLLDLEKTPGDENLIHRAFRLAHNIKSGSAAMGMNAMSHLTHTVETILAGVREEKRTIEERLMTLLLQSTDVLKAMMASAAEDGTDKGVEVAGLLAELEPYAKASRQPEPPALETGMIVVSPDRLASARDNFDHIYEIRVKFAEVSAMCSLKAYLILTKLENHGEILASSPHSDQLEECDQTGRFAVILATDAAHSVVKASANVDMVERLEVEEARTEPPVREKTPPRREASLTPPREAEERAARAPAAMRGTAASSAESSETLRVDVHKLDGLINLVGELVIHRAGLTRRSNNLAGIFSDRRMVHHLGEIADLLIQIRKELPQEAASQVDEAVRRLGEHRERLAEIFHHEADVEEVIASVDRLGKITNQLQTGIMQTRMVPIGTLFRRFHRVVRDLSKQQGKKVALYLNGEETELDKKVIDELGSPLTHIIRNSIDHGLEDPEERQAKGKLGTGTITMNAYHEGGRICIEVTDDGRGLNIERIKEKGLERGLVTAEEAETLSDDQAVELVFHPGFSTAQKVTDVSGRGVGMDVVKRNIEALKGTVSLASRPGQGTTLVIRLPLTLAIIMALLVRVGDQVFAMPVEAVREIIKIPKAEVIHVGTAQTVQFRNQALSLITLDAVIQGPSNQEKEGGDYRVVVVGSNDRAMGIIVDQLLGEEEIVIKSLSRDFGRVRGVAGASIMGDGSVSLILDVGAVMEMASGHAGGRS